MSINVTKQMQPLGVSVEEAARLSSLSKYTIRGLVRKNLIKTVRVGRRIVVPVSEIGRLVEEGLPSDKR